MVVEDVVWPEPDEPVGHARVERGDERCDIAHLAIGHAGDHHRPKDPDAVPSLMREILRVPEHRSHRRSRESAVDRIRKCLDLEGDRPAEIDDPLHRLQCSKATGRYTDTEIESLPLHLGRDLLDVGEVDDRVSARKADHPDTRAPVGDDPFPGVGDQHRRRNVAGVLPARIGVLGDAVGVAVETAVAAPSQGDDIARKGARTHRRRHLRPADTAYPPLALQAIDPAPPLAEGTGLEIMHTIL